MGLLTDLLSVLLVGGAAVAGTAALGYACYKTYKYLTADRVKEAAREKFPRALKVIIQERKKNSVKCGVFGRNNQQLDSMELGGEMVSDRLRPGYEIYL